LRNPINLLHRGYKLIAKSVGTQIIDSVILDIIDLGLAATKKRGGYTLWDCGYGYKERT
jgi:hypothetical protein